MLGRGTAAGGGMLTDDGIGALASSEPPRTRDNVVVAGSLLRAGDSSETDNAVYGTTSLRRDITVSPSDSAWRAWFGWRPYGSPDRRWCGATRLSGAGRTWRATCARCGKRTIAQACCFSITARADSIVVVDVTGSAEGTENRRLTLHVVSRGHVLSNASTAPTLILKAPSTRSPSTMGRRGHNRRRGAGGAGPVAWTSSQRARGWRGPSVDAGTSRGASPVVCGIAQGRLHRAPYLHLAPRTPGAEQLA